MYRFKQKMHYSVLTLSTLLRILVFAQGYFYSKPKLFDEIDMQASWAPAIQENKAI